MVTERTTRTGRSTRSLGALVELLNQPRFIVRKRFLDGPLVGLEVDDNSPVAFEVGKTYGYGSKYEVVSCEEISK